MAGKRKYDQGCAVAHALDLIGERWALLVVRDLVLGPKRFTDLLAGLPGASPDVLTQRLRELTDGRGPRLPPAMRYDAPLGTDSLILSLKALFDGSPAADLNATIALHLGDEPF